MKRTVGFCVLLLTALTFSSEGVFADGPGKELFTDAPLSDELKDKQEEALLDSTIIRNRYVTIDFNYLAGEDYSRGADAVILNLFYDKSMTAVRERFERRGFGNRYTWFGRIEGVDYSQVIMVVENGVMAANVYLPDGSYQIRYVGREIHTINAMDQAAFPEEEPPISMDVELMDSAEPIPPEAADDGSTIDIMVVYTAAAASGGNILSEIQLAIDETNTSYLNSGINPRLRLVHIEQVTYSESGNIQIDRDRLRNPADGYMDSVHSLRDTYGADLVGLWVANGGGYCGIAYIMTTVSTSFENYGFMVVARSCATGYYSFGHEFGHIQSARHDWYVDPTNNSPYTYNHGYVYSPGQWRTVMAYNSSCFSCTRIPYWSNPDVLYGGVPMGVPEGQYHAADNRKTLNNTAWTVANFRQSAEYAYVLTDSYGYVWKLNEIDSSPRGKYLTGIVDIGNEERDVFATYLFSNSTLSMSVEEGSGVAFNSLYRWSGGGGSGAWISISPTPSYGTSTISLGADADLITNIGLKPGVAQNGSPPKALLKHSMADPYTLTDSFGFDWTLDVIDSNSTAIYLSGTVYTGDVENAVAIYLKSSAGVSQSGERGSGVPFNYNYRWTGSGGSGVWIELGPPAAHGHVQVAVPGSLDPDSDPVGIGQASGKEARLADPDSPR